MAIFSSKTQTPAIKPTLVETLAQRASQLRDSEEFGHQRAQTLRDQASQVQSEAVQSAKHAEAVEKANKILADAGVNF